MCQVCGTVLPKYRFKYCSKYCSSTAVNSNSKKLRQTAAVMRQYFCHYCGEEFHSSRKIAKYCSRSCHDKSHRRQWKKFNIEKERARKRRQYLKSNRIERKREIRAIRAAARQVYNELLGLSKPHKVRIQFGAPIVKIGEWSSYLVLPSSLRLYRKSVRYDPVLTSKQNSGTYTGQPALYCIHFRELITHRRQAIGNRHNHGTRNDVETSRRRTRERENTNLLRALKSLNLLPEERTDT